MTGALSLLGVAEHIVLVPYILIRSFLILTLVEDSAYLVRDTTNVSQGRLVYKVLGGSGKQCEQPVDRIDGKWKSLSNNER